MSSHRTVRTLSLAACVALVFAAVAPAKILGKARAKAKKTAAARTIGKRRTARPSPRSSRMYNGPRTLGRPPRVQYRPNGFGSPYGYGRGYGMSAGYGYGGFVGGGYPMISTTPVAASTASRNLGSARVGLRSNVGRASRVTTFGGRNLPSTFRSPTRAPAQDVSFSRVQAARQQFQRRYGFSD